MVVCLSKRKRKSKYLSPEKFSAQQYLKQLKHQSKKSKGKTSSQNFKTSSPATFKVNVPKQPKKKETQTPKESAGNLLQQYKHSREVINNLPTERQISWKNFLEGLEQLPADIQIKFTQTIEWLSQKYGEELVAYYLEQRDLLDEMSTFSSIDYKSIIAIQYLYKLAAGLELAVEGYISEDSRDMANEAEWMVESNVKKERNKVYFMDRISDEEIQDINLTIALDEYADSISDELE